MFALAGKALSGTQLENALIGQLVGQKLPRLFAKLQELGLPHELFTTEWIMTLFAKVRAGSARSHGYTALILRACSRVHMRA